MMKYAVLTASILANGQRDLESAYHRAKWLLPQELLATFLLWVKTVNVDGKEPWPYPLSRTLGLFALPIQTASTWKDGTSLLKEMVGGV